MEKEIEDLRSLQLKDAVSKLSLDKLCLEKVIEVAEQEYDVDFKKKSGSSASRQSEKKY